MIAYENIVKNEATLINVFMSNIAVNFREINEVKR